MVPSGKNPPEPCPYCAEMHDRDIRETLRQMAELEARDAKIDALEQIRALWYAEPHGPACFCARCERTRELSA